MALQKPLTLKSYFVRDAIPTQLNFEDLIDSVLTKQVDDSHSVQEISGIVTLQKQQLAFVETATDVEPDDSDSSTYTFLVDHFKALLTETTEEGTKIIAEGLTAQALLTFSENATSSYVGRVFTCACVPANRLAITYTGFAGTVLYDVDADTLTIYK
ncbi:MAG: hypothetical protein AAF570_21455 [Bacteroidota bacterium]